MLLGEIACYLYMLSSLLLNEDSKLRHKIREREMKVGYQIRNSSSMYIMYERGCSRFSILTNKLHDTVTLRKLLKFICMC